MELYHDENKKPTLYNGNQSLKSRVHRFYLIPVTNFFQMSLKS